VEDWKETIRKASDAFSEIIVTIERTSEASAQISLATHQQTSANEQVAQAMRQIAEMVRVSAGHNEGIHRVGGELRSMARSCRRRRPSSSIGGHGSGKKDRPFPVPGEVRRGGEDPSLQG